MTPLKAIRAKCLDCSCDQDSEVRNCVVPKCPLFPYRMGKRPEVEGRVKRTISPEHLAKMQAARRKS